MCHRLVYISYLCYSLFPWSVHKDISNSRCKNLHKHSYLPARYTFVAVTKQNSATVTLLYHNPPLTLIPIILLVSMSLCVIVISSLFHPPLPPLFHSSITQDAFPSWKQASQHGKGQGRGGQVSTVGGHRGCLCHSSACCRPHCGPSWGSQAHVILAHPLAYTCCHQNGDDTLTPALQQLLAHGSHKDTCANKLPQLSRCHKRSCRCCW